MIYPPKISTVSIQIYKSLIQSKQWKSEYNSQPLKWILSTKLELELWNLKMMYAWRNSCVVNLEKKFEI